MNDACWIQEYRFWTMAVLKVTTATELLHWFLTEMTKTQINIVCILVHFEKSIINKLSQPLTYWFPTVHNVRLYCKLLLNKQILSPWHKFTQNSRNLRFVFQCICLSWAGWRPPCGRSRCRGREEIWTAACTHISSSDIHPGSCHLDNNCNRRGKIRLILQYPSSYITE